MESVRNLAVVLKDRDAVTTRCPVLEAFEDLSVSHSLVSALVQMRNIFGKHCCSTAGGVQTIDSTGTEPLDCRLSAGLTWSARFVVPHNHGKGLHHHWGGLGAVSFLWL